MPRPRRNSSSPSSRSSRSERSTVLVLTPRTAARSFAGGRRSPGFASPSAIARRISPATCSYRSVGSPLSTLTFSMVLVTLSQSCRTCSCDRHRPASPAPPGRSRRPRGARGPRRGADRGGEAARPASAAHLRSRRGAGGARRSHGVRGLRAQRTVADCFPCALRAVGLPAGTTSSKLAFVRTMHSACCGRGPIALYVMNADGSGQRRLTSDVFGRSAWSPDGQKIAFNVTTTASSFPGPITRR